MRAAARTAAREAEGVSLNCSTNVVLGGARERTAARATARAAARGAEGFSLNCSTVNSAERTEPEGRECGLRRVRRRIRRGKRRDVR